MLHFIVDVVRNPMTEGPERTLFKGLHVALSMGEVLVAATGFVFLRAGASYVAVLAFGLVAVAGWLAFTFAFVPVWPPRLWLMLVLALLLAAAAL